MLWKSTYHIPKFLNIFYKTLLWEKFLYQPTRVTFKYSLLLNFTKKHVYFNYSFFFIQFLNIIKFLTLITQLNLFFLCFAQNAYYNWVNYINWSNWSYQFFFWKYSSNLFFNKKMVFNHNLNNLIFFFKIRNYDFLFFINYERYALLIYNSYFFKLPTIGIIPIYTHPWFFTYFLISSSRLSLISLWFLLYLILLKKKSLVNKYNFIKYKLYNKLLVNVFW